MEIEKLIVEKIKWAINASLQKTSAALHECGVDIKEISEWKGFDAIESDIRYACNRSYVKGYEDGQKKD